MKYRLTPKGSEKTLFQLLLEAGAAMDFPCSGNHRCGKCKVRAKGSLAAIKPSEAAMLSKEEIASGIRMACFAKATGPVEVEITDAGADQIMSSGLGSIEVSDPLIEEGAYGAVVDIGTTTLVCKLYSRDGVELGSKSEINHQRKFGADVISRINYGIKNGNEPVHETIVEQIESMLASLATAAGIKRSTITSAVVTGNTTMLHFFAGLDPKGIGFLPFTPASLFNCTVDNILRGVKVYLPPCVSAYVGADITCDVLASGMYREQDRKILMIDIGTNGEMVLCSGGVLYCCSTAAGPAFEGAGISCGMTAAPGAIEHVRFSDGKLAIETIGGAPALGICGSGIVDAVAALLDSDALLPGGRISREHCQLAALIDQEETQFSFVNNIAVTQEDIRQIQLAKGAVRAGALTLCMKCGAAIEDLDALYLAGGFGAFLSLQAAEKIGLIPPGSADRTTVLGNGAIAGASMLLLNSGKVKTMDKIVKMCSYIELSGNDLFMENYINAIPFGSLADGEDE